jgi:hypothetical protein
MSISSAPKNPLGRQCRLPSTSLFQCRYFFASQRVMGYGYRAGKSETPEFRVAQGALSLTLDTTSALRATIRPQLVLR